MEHGAGHGGGHGMERGLGRHADPDERWLAVTVHGAFFLLLGSSFARFLTRDQGGGALTEWVVALFAVFCLLYVLGSLLAPPPRPGAAPTARHLVWLGSVTAVWVALLVLAPSATWCAMPLLFAGLHALPPRIAVPVAAVLTVLVVVSEIRVADGALNPNMVVAPPAVAAVATAVLVHLQRQGVRQRVLIEDLVRTRHELAATGRRAGVLAERQRLATEIHDTLAQGLSSQRMLLQAAERVWDADPDAAREHLGKAAEITSRNLVEARRFVHDLAPADLSDQSLPDALTVLAHRESGPGLTVEFRLDGEPDPGRLPERVEAALLRIAQGALANIREHAAATRAAVTLTFLDDQVSLDVADNGRGFDVCVRVGEGGGGDRSAEARSSVSGEPVDPREAAQPVIGGAAGWPELDPASGETVTARASKALADGRASGASADGREAGDRSDWQEAGSPAHEPAGAEAVDDSTTGALADSQTSGNPSDEPTAPNPAHEPTSAQATEHPTTTAPAASQATGRPSDEPDAASAASGRPVGRADGARGHGLPAMRIRARQLGGVMTVESTPGEGTVVSVAVPLAPLPSVPVEEAAL